ncbi:hypothetical protein ASE71_14170 [Ensifer sp. Root954]|nr:hypothetical protein ASD49_18610 [Ensifer sp. Root1298]KQX84137.1 hypothetical protein ASD41_31650 [Ensifer sp. Root1312]KRC22423.1 hypothetical protein ASE29_30120 [Ensifer sp. Root74]KRD56870.1 hypothetical protein ASE71_14170 [Ensifer sp. Root954]OWZ90027.1 hypothetical protein B9J07_30305 [Sinorhizobium sp. LM21]
MPVKRYVLFRVFRRDTFYLKFYSNFILVYSFGSSHFYIGDAVDLLTLLMRTVADHIRLSRKRLALAPGDIDVHVIE